MAGWMTNEERTFSPLRCLAIYSGAKQFKVYHEFGTEEKVMLVPTSKGFILCMVVILLYQRRTWLLKELNLLVHP